VEQAFITLENRPASRRKSVVDSQVEGWAKWAKWAMMNKTLYSDAKKTSAIREMFGNTTRYEKQKAATIQHLFLILAAHPEAMVRCLADLVPHPKTQELVFRFVVFCTGRKTESKKCVVNSVMTIFALNLIMINKNNDTALDLDTLPEKEIADLQYAPSTHGLYYKHIFYWMNNESILFAQKDFKGMRGKSFFRIFCNWFYHYLTLFCLHFQLIGSFLAAIKDKFAKTLKVRPDYGKRKSTPVDPLAQAKVRRVFKDGILNPFATSMANSDTDSGYDDLNECLLHKMGTSFGPRSMIEPAAWTVSCFEWGIEDRCEAMMGEKFVRCKGFNGADKTSKLTLANPYQFEMGNYLKMWDLRGNPMNPVNLFFFMMEKHLTPAMEFHGLTDAPLFNSRAVGKELKVHCLI